MHLDSTQIIAALGGVVMFLGGIVLSGVRRTVARLEAADKEVFKRLGRLETELSALKSAHDTVMSSGGHHRK